MKRVLIALGIATALALPAGGIRQAVASNVPTTQGALVIHGGCGYSDLLVTFPGGGTQDFGSTSGYLTYVGTPSGNATFQCTQTLDNPALAPSRTLVIGTTCQVDAGPVLPGFAILTPSGRLQTICLANGAHS